LFTLKFSLLCSFVFIVVYCEEPCLKFFSSHFSKWFWRNNSLYREICCLEVSIITIQTTYNNFSQHQLHSLAVLFY
jgi:hypothetical protein